jgi:hypothetical protein
MWILLPWRLTHSFLLLVGCLFLASYLNLLSWGPVADAIQYLVGEPGIIRAEAVFGLVTLLLLTPLAAMVTLFLLLLVWVGLAAVLGPIARALRVPDWAFTMLLAATSAGIVYTKSGMWLPWSMSVIDRITNAYLIPLL